MQCLRSKLQELQLLTQEVLQVSNKLSAYCRKRHHTDYYLLKSIPGIGGILAAAILAELGDIRRFDNERVGYELDGDSLTIVIAPPGLCPKELSDKNDQELIICKRKGS